MPSAAVLNAASPLPPITSARLDCGFVFFRMRGLLRSHHAIRVRRFDRLVFRQLRFFDIGALRLDGGRCRRIVGKSPYRQIRLLDMRSQKLDPDFDCRRTQIIVRIVGFQIIRKKRKAAGMKHHCRQSGEHPQPQLTSSQRRVRRKVGRRRIYEIAPQGFT